MRVRLNHFTIIIVHLTFCITNLYTNIGELIGTSTSDSRTSAGGVGAPQLENNLPEGKPMNCTDAVSCDYSVYVL